MAASKPLSKEEESEAERAALAWTPEGRSGEEKQLGKNIAGGLRRLSKEGNLTADLLKEARSRGKEGLAFEDDGFDSFLEKEGIGVSEEGAEEGAKDPYEAAQRVMGAKTGLDRLTAMQDPNYQLGSGSALRQAPRQLGTRSGAMRRAARSLRRVGASAQANQMFGAAAAQKLGEPNIMTEEQRGRVAAKQQQAADLTSKTQEQESIYMDYANKIMKRRIKGMDDEESGGIRKYRGTRPLGAQSGSNIPKAKSDRSNISQSSRN